MNEAIVLDGVGKRYWKLEEQAMLLRSLLPFRRPKRSEMWALRDIDFVVNKGETVGVLGRNGAGKTSMLRLLAGVSQPSEGHLTIRGRVAPLIGVGVGFHREMSGRENVFLNGMLLGLTKPEIEERFDEIVAFAELPDFIDTPVKFYSSGMFMRLGFSVAIHTDPEVLLVDEVLAVGDLAFQLKCFRKMRQLQTSGTTVVMVSHSMHAIRNLCPRAILMDRGRIVFDGEVEKAIVLNHELMTKEATKRAAESNGDGGEHQQELHGGVTIVSRQVEGPLDELPRGSAWPLTYCARLRFDQEVQDPCLNFQVFAEDGTLAFSTFSAINHQWRTFRAGEESVLRIVFTPRLAGGTYRLSLAVTSSDLRALLANDNEGILLYIPPRIGSAGIAELNATVRLDGVVINDPDVMGMGLVAPDRKDQSANISVEDIAETPV